MDGASLLHLLFQRRSIRKYSDACVSSEIIYTLLEQAGLAPSAGNCQDYHFTVIKNAHIKEHLAEVVRMKVAEKVESIRATNPDLAETFFSYSKNFFWFSSAPVLIAVSCRAVDSFQQEYFGARPYAVSGSVVSAAMASQNLMLAATAANLSTCCLTGPLIASEEIKKMLKMSIRRDLVCLLTLGYAAESPSMPERKAVNSICEILE